MGISADKQGNQGLPSKSNGDELDCAREALRSKASTKKQGIGKEMWGGPNALAIMLWAQLADGILSSHTLSGHRPASDIN